MATGEQPSPTPAASRRPGLRWLLFAVFLAAIGGFYALGLHEYFTWDSVRANLDAYQEEVQAQLLLSLAVFFIVYALITALSLPVASILTLLAGALFGRLLGTGVALSGATLGATLAFLSSRFLFRDWVQARFAARLDALNRGFERDGAYYLFSLRLVPLFPFFLINLGMGLTPMRTWTYTWVSFVGMLPGSFLYVNAGRALATLESPRDLLSTDTIVSLVLLGIAPLAFRWLLRLRPTGAN
jgi:uncharacterized membrane protein YdjX (TVP38/TMEM64 family)